MRQLRRRTVSVSGEQRLTNGQVVELTAARLAVPQTPRSPPRRHVATSPLRHVATSLAIVLLACAAVAAHA